MGGTLEIATYGEDLLLIDLRFGNRIPINRKINEAILIHMCRGFGEESGRAQGCYRVGLLGLDP